MIVYRVESTTLVDPRTGLGAGPFASTWRCEPDSARRELITEMVMDHIVESRERGLTLRTPVNDPLLRGIYEDEVCGVDSKDALRVWFGETLPALIELGYAVFEYEVPEEHARCGLNGQVLFQFDQISSRKQEEYA